MIKYCIGMLLVGLVMLGACIRNSTDEGRLRKSSLMDRILERIPFFYGGHPRAFSTSISGMSGDTAEFLREFGEPTGVVWPKDIPMLFSDEPWTAEEGFRIGIWDKGTDAVSILTGNQYREYAMFELWLYWQPTLKTYQPNWHESEQFAHAVVWVYSEQEIFGKRAFSPHAWFIFIRDDKVIMRTGVYRRGDNNREMPTLNGDRALLLSRKSFYEKYPDAGQSQP